MTKALKAPCLLLALLQLAPPAFAQNAPAPPVPSPPPPAETLPPESAPIVPAAVPPAPGLQPPFQQYPPSSQILQVNINPLQVTRGGIETPDLMLAVSGSPLAQNLIQSGESKVATGHAVSATGLVIWIGAIVASIIMSGAYGDHPTTAQANAVGATAFFGILGGITVELIGDGIRADGRRSIVQGINAYNADLLDGRIAVPNYRPAQ